MSRYTQPVLAEPGLESPLSAAEAAHRSETIAMVRDALKHRRAMLAFQPVVQARMPKRAAFFEGFMRLLDDQGRVIPAADFIGAIENSELGRRVDCLALEMGLEQLARDPALRLSVNMSARSIGYPGWLTALERGLRVDPSIGERLILEITEGSAMLMPDLVTVFMQDMQERGICFALDDFGAGYTAFRYLKEFYFDIVKIDGQFIRGIHQDPDNQILAQALVSIARHFDMFTVAENVETAAEARFLVDIGVDCLQGFHFGAPSATLPWQQSQHERKTG
ncbi:MAG: EAL domain-containing protein [Rhodobacteraceae bacterium]|nr:EAL domain-containing protein [Paracoccaceae bacterium]